MSLDAERQKALESALAHIEKEYGKGAVMKLGDQTSMRVEAVPTGSLSLDLALGVGGLPDKKIRQPLLAARPDYQIHVGNIGGVQSAPDKLLRNITGRELPFARVLSYRADSMNDLISAAVVDSQKQGH